MIEALDRLCPFAFFAVATALLLPERVPALPRQPAARSVRSTSNVGLWLTGSLVAGALLPARILAFAQQRPEGAIAVLGLPLAAEVAPTFLLLDRWK